MNIKKLSDITGVNIETIRSYRKKGYLHPETMENGYYDYSSADLSTLFWIRKLRGYEMSMNQIEDYFTSADRGRLIELLSEKKDILTQEIETLEQSMRFIDLEIRHINETGTEARSAQLFQSIDDKFDVYSLHHRSDRFRELSFSMTPTVHITRDILNGPLEDRQIPIEIGMGTYGYILEEHGFPVPHDAVVVPNGLCITQLLILDNFERIPLRDLHPMINYARANHLTFESDTTGYLMRIQIVSGKPLFHFRVRACIERNEIRDPSVLARKKRED